MIYRDKINIYDIPISHITSEYLAYLEIMQEIQLEVAGEFFVMAATLMRIKAQMLLPRQVEEEEEEDPRDELVRNLLEYRKFKEAAQHLADREQDRRKVYARPTVKPPEDGPQIMKIEVTLFDLVGAFRKVLDDLKKQAAFKVKRETVTIEEKVQVIRSSLEDRSEVLFTELFRDGFSKMDVIVTFLAILELIRLGELIAKQMSQGSDIWLYRPKGVAYIQTGEANHDARKQQRRR